LAEVASTCRQASIDATRCEKLSEKSRRCAKRASQGTEAAIFGLIWPSIPTKSALGALLRPLFRQFLRRRRKLGGNRRRCRRLIERTCRRVVGVLRVGGFGGWDQGGEGDEDKQCPRKHHQCLLRLGVDPPISGPRPLSTSAPAAFTKAATTDISVSPSDTSHTPRRPFFGLCAPASCDGFDLLAACARLATYASYTGHQRRAIPLGGAFPQREDVSGLLCVTLSLMPALLPRGDESAMNTWRTFLVVRQSEVPGDSWTTSSPGPESLP
jgi:hypothetical protein